MSNDSRQKEGEGFLKEGSANKGALVGGKKHGMEELGPGAGARKRGLTNMVHRKGPRGRITALRQYGEELPGGTAGDLDLSKHKTSKGHSPPLTEGCWVVKKCNMLEMP